MSYVVCWSGGADSTLVLDYYAGVSCHERPIRAISVVSHRHLSKPFMEAQAKARSNYLKLAKKKGYHIRYERLSVSGNWDFGKSKEDSKHSIGQPIIWLSALIQVVSDGDIVLMSYIRNDCFWHFKSEFEDAFKALCRLKGVDVKLEYPYEYSYKSGILDMLKERKVPNNCWFSCESTKDGKQCGSCFKCDEIDNAKKRMNY